MRIKHFITCLFLSISACLLAQTPNEIAQFSQVYNLSTARVIGMNGAAGVLKSEIGSININPANLGMFQTGELSLSPMTNRHSNQSDYLGADLSKTRQIFSIAGGGAAYSFENRDKHGAFRRFNVAFVYSYNNSFSAYYNNFAAQQPDKEQTFAQSLLNDYGDNFFLEEFNDGNGRLKDNYKVPASQEGKLTTTGYSADYMLSFGTTFRDKLYIGLMAGMSSLNYERSRLLTERSLDDGGDKYTIDDSQLRHTTSGFGYNFRVGVIYSPIDNLYLGIAAQSPTFYQLNVNETISAALSPCKRAGQNELVRESYNYQLQTPWRVTFSAGYAFTSIMTVTFDYEIVTNNLISLSGDFGEMTKPKADNFEMLNKTIIPDKFNLAMNVRVGGEVRFGNAFMRAGIAYLGAPTDMIKNTFSGSVGFGYSFGDASIDAAYRYAGNSEDLTLYNSSSLIKSTITNHLVGLTVAYRF